MSVAVQAERQCSLRGGGTDPLDAANRPQPRGDGDGFHRRDPNVEAPPERNNDPPFSYGAPPQPPRPGQLHVEERTCGCAVPATAQRVRSFWSSRVASVGEDQAPPVLRCARSLRPDDWANDAWTTHSHSESADGREARMSPRGAHGRPLALSSFWSEWLSLYLWLQLRSLSRGAVSPLPCGRGRQHRQRRVPRGRRR